jgi:ABC-type Fe3+ transport system permease subunit
MLLAFTLAIEEFGVPAALGSRAGVVMLTVGIEKKLADWPVDLPARAAVAAADGGGAVRLVAAKAAGGGERGHQRHRQTGRKPGRRWAG